MPETTRTLYDCLSAIFCILILATFTLFILKRNRPHHNWLELQQRINSWWAISCLFSLAMMSPKWLALTLFGLMSFLSLKEYLTFTSARRPENKSLIFLYAAVPLQYLWVGMSWHDMYMTFIPIYGFLILPALMMVTGHPQGFLRSVTVVYWGMMMTVFALSHVAFLLVLPNDNVSVGALLVVFLVVLTEINDIAQYLWGKSFGRMKVMPKVSPNKTLAGLLGGVGTTMFLAVLLGPVLTQMDWLYSLYAGVIIGLGGFCGDMTMSAIKRDIGVKDTGTLIPGHGGILDRLDSLIYTAPLFFHFYDYFYN